MVVYQILLTKNHRGTLKQQGVAHGDQKFGQTLVLATECVLTETIAQTEAVTPTDNQTKSEPGTEGYSLCKLLWSTQELDRQTQEIELLVR